MAPANDPLVTRGEVLKQYRISPPTLKEWMKNGLPFFRFGRSVRFSHADLEAWLERHRVDRGDEGIAA